MGLMKSAFNAVARFHSQPGFIKRPGTPDIYSPMRITPANYFRYIQGPAQTVITGNEGIIPAATILGTQVQDLTFSGAPALAATFTLSYNGNSTSALDWSTATASDVQTALRLLIGLANIAVAGTGPFHVTMTGIQDPLKLVAIPPAGGVIDVSYGTNLAFDPLIKRGDRLIIGSQLYSAKEIIEMPDLGGEVLGYRVRYE